MSLGGNAPPSFIVIFAGAACIIMGMPISMALGISESIFILIGVGIMIIGTPLSFHMGKDDDITAFPPCVVFGFTGALILFGGLWLSFPFGGNPLGSALVILGILQAVVGGALGTLYVRRRRKGGSSSSWPRHQVERFAQSRRDAQQYEYKPRKERVIEREVLLKQRIPLECDNCGAPINPEELDWIGSDTIKCLNCGHSLRVETERV